MPRAQRWELVEAARQLTDRQAREALRNRLMPFVLRPGQNLYVTAGKRGRQIAGERGLNVAATADPDDFLHALQIVFGKQILTNARFHLARDTPIWSASTQLTPAQTSFAVFTVAALLAGFWFVPQLTTLLVLAGFSVLFLSVVATRLAGILPFGKPDFPPGRYLSDEQLPVYTVLVPLYREPRVIDQLLTGLASLRYPADKLDIKIILEQNDPEMCHAFANIVLPEHYEVIVVPDAKPKTKPKALNYALHFARGDLVVVFDAEDIPEPNQLLVAAETFAAGGDDLVCLQASLTFYNANENWLTRQFTIEYAVLFDLVLPFFAALRLPFPLGGTSNHFKMKALRKLGCWDPFNVTEDADLGIRLARFGWRADVLPSSTFEEANNRFSNWMPQRARWLKGWMQTWFVHMRQPGVLLSQLGLSGFVAVQVMMSGVIISTLAHPFFLAWTIWSIASGRFMPVDQDWTYSILTGLGLAVLVAGYGITLWAGKAALKARRLNRLWPGIFAMPFYWLMVSLGGWLALKQFIFNPFHWNKTEHGLSRLNRSPRRQTRYRRRAPSGSRTGRPGFQPLQQRRSRSRSVQPH